MKSLHLSERDQDQQGYMEQVVRYFVIRYSRLDVDDSENYNEFLTNEILRIVESGSINFNNEESIFKRVFNLIYRVLDEDCFKKYSSEKSKFLGPVLVGAYEVILPGLIKNLDYFEKDDKSDELISLVKSIYTKAEYLDAVRRGVRPVTRLKKLVAYSEELFRIEN
jgi:hypothetical protein